MKYTYLSFVAAIILAIAAGSLLTTGCTKEGPPGDPGADGKDATESCMKCHNFTEDIEAKIAQHAKSVHASGENISRNNEGCAHCHTSQGFRDYLVSGQKAFVPNPTAINCRTCHPIHEKYTPDDYQLRTTAEVGLAVSGFKYNYGNSNICAHCHQARPTDPQPVPGGNPVTIKNARFGPHYGPQADIFAGKGGYEIAGSLPYQNSKHTDLVAGGCVSCHMANPVGYFSGGHQMGLRQTSGGSISFNYNGCTGCHQDLNSIGALRGEHRTEISGLLKQLKSILTGKGYLDAEGKVKVPLTIPADEAGIILNYKYIEGDGSFGMHNYLYTKALLLNSLEHLQ